MKSALQKLKALFVAVYHYDRREMTSDKKSGMAKKSTVPTANLKIVVSNIVSVLASVCWMKSDYHTLI